MSKRIAIIIIHGIGEQAPFETLDDFSRPFIDIYSKLVKTKHPNLKISKKHVLGKLSGWIESYVSVYSDNADLPVIDVYEYYWAHMTQREITVGEVCQWIIEVARGARDFYKKRKDKVQRSDKNYELFENDGEFKHFKYFVKILTFGNKIRYFLSLLLSPLFIKLKRNNWFSDIVLRALSGPVVDYMGDVALYCSTDKKSKYFDVRQRILKGAYEKSKFLLESDQYSEILFAGHSLGSVIAYDTLDRLNKEMNVNPQLREYASKIKGLVTFGSPLDKISFFFDEKIDQDRQNIRYAIVSQLHSFKRVNVDTTSLENGVDQCLGDVKWLNFWTKPDPVSGHLDVYKDVSNIELDFSKTIGDSNLSVKSHSLYWQSEEMYQQIIREFEAYFVNMQ